MKGLQVGDFFKVTFKELDRSVKQWIIRSKTWIINWVFDVYALNLSQCVAGTVYITLHAFNVLDH